LRDLYVAVTRATARLGLVHSDDLETEIRGDAPAPPT